MRNPKLRDRELGSKTAVRILFSAIWFGLLATPALIGTSPASASPASSIPVATSLGRCGTTFRVRFDNFAFSPSTVPEGGTATLYMTVQNCTGNAFSGSVETFGNDVCLILDPIRQPISLQRHESVTLTMSYSVPECTGTGTITGRLLSHNGKTIATNTASFQSVVPRPTPTIVANPDSVSQNSDTTLTGTNFPPDSTLDIDECSSTTWVVVAQNPCLTSNTIVVATNGTGGFFATLEAELCPGTSPTPVSATAANFAQLCYVGEPEPNGVDTVGLVGAEAIVVTGGIAL